MDEKKSENHVIATVGWALLLIWWGISFAIGPITIGMSAIGTGLIMLGVNAYRSLRGIPTPGSTTALGVIALVWGTLDTAFALRFEASLAVLLIVIGGSLIVSLIPRLRTA
jgi:hypothetical protein